MLEIESYEESLNYDKHFKTDLDEFSEFQAIGAMHQSLYNVGRVGHKARQITCFL